MLISLHLKVKIFNLSWRLAPKPHVILRFYLCVSEWVGVRGMSYSGGAAAEPATGLFNSRSKVQSSMWEAPGSPPRPCDGVLIPPSLFLPVFYLKSITDVHISSHFRQKINNRRRTLTRWWCRYRRHLAGLVLGLKPTTLDEDFRICERVKGQFGWIQQVR